MTKIESRFVDRRAQVVQIFEIDIGIIDLERKVAYMPYDFTKVLDDKEIAKKYFPYDPHDLAIEYQRLCDELEKKGFKINEYKR